MSYDFAGGALKLKGVSDKTIKKKKKVKNTVKDVILKTVSKPDVSDINGDTSNDPKIRQSSHDNPAKEVRKEDLSVNSVMVKIPARTKAELAFEKLQDKRAEEKILKRAEKSHKEHVENYNRHLDSLSEYNDIPKVSWTK